VPRNLLFEALLERLKWHEEKKGEKNTSLDQIKVPTSDKKDEANGSEKKEPLPTVTEDLVPSEARLSRY
jgi:hypothetical protein